MEPTFAELSTKVECVTRHLHLTELLQYTVEERGEQFGSVRAFVFVCASRRVCGSPTGPDGEFYTAISRVSCERIHPRRSAVMADFISFANKVLNAVALPVSKSLDFKEMQGVAEAHLDPVKIKRAAASSAGS
ncbi:hypothetical protein EVAR_31572_1 [Eumeta japonica]|uniref:Uncharacterized protein n=1 Tax=Eumeta variegata TaxID=151549 RepID=A0A4C1V7B3_EUMVA|nr:hypothetical protein EVAR_31572_1 [Eumeta japonica]